MADDMVLGCGDEDLVDDVREVLEAEGGVAEFVVHEIRDEAEAEEAEDVTGTPALRAAPARELFVLAGALFRERPFSCIKSFSRTAGSLQGGHEVGDGVKGAEGDGAASGPAAARAALSASAGAEHTRTGTSSARPSSPSTLRTQAASSSAARARGLLGAYTEKLRAHGITARTMAR